MYPRPLAFLPAVLIAILAGCSSSPPSSQSPNAGSSPPAAALGNGPEQALQKGMTAEAVKRIMGEPAEIKPMQSPTGTAETWVYHCTVQGPVEQIQVGTRTDSIVAKGSDGQDHVVQTVEEPVFKQQFHFIEETVRLLMFDGRLIEQHRAVQKRTEYH